MPKKSAIDTAIAQLEADLKLAQFEYDQSLAQWQAKFNATEAAIAALRRQQKPRKPRVVAMNQAG